MVDKKKQNKDEEGEEEEEEEEEEEKEGEEGEKKGGASDDEDDEDGEEEEDEEEEEEDTGLTENQNRLLYLVSLYSKPAVRATDKEEWIRKPALMVLIYEAIVSQALDYDYAPSSELVEGTRKYFNISQEGKSDLDFLREEELLNGLKLSSKSYQPVTCYQISEKGLELISKIGKVDKAPVNDMAYAPGTRNLLQVEWDGEDYWLGDKESGFRRLSAVTETEDVSYVSSAYVPQCLRHGGRPTLSNAHRAHECGISNSSIRDELDEIITLNSVSLIVAEFIPFGANQVVQLNTNLGSTDRVQGGFFTAVIDDQAGATQLSVEPGLTSINILDYTLTNHVNFEADIHFPEAPGIVQVETFGCSLTAAGSCFYGMQVEAIMDRIKDNISLDHLSRLLVDVHMDSSKIVDSVLSPYQRSLLNLIFNGDASTRNKVNLIIANEITPHLTAEEYMDKGEYENELKQVIGDTRAAFDISEHDTLIFGAHGLLIAGPNSRHHEPLLCAYLEYDAMGLFTQNFFGRMFVVVDDMKTIRRLIESSDRDPNRLHEIFNRIAALSKEIILLEETLGYLKESLEEAFIPPEPPEQAGRSLYERLQLGGMKEQLARRVKDLNKNMEGARHELDVLQEMSNVTAQNKTFKLNESVVANTRKLCTLQKENKRSVTSLEVIQVVLSGSLAFDILDRIAGDFQPVNGLPSWVVNFRESMMNATEPVWLFFSLFIWALVGSLLLALLRFLTYRSQGVVTIQIRRQEPIDLKALRTLTLTKNLMDETHDYDGEVRIAKLSWVETGAKNWGGVAPTVQIEYDEENAFMLNITIIYERRKANKNLAFNAEELYTKLIQELDNAKIFQKLDSDAKKQLKEPFEKADK